MVGKLKRSLISFGLVLITSTATCSEPTLQPVWERQLGTDGHDFSGGVSVDQVGNLFFAMNVSGPFAGDYGGGYDVVVGKYDLDGNLKWAHQYGTDSSESASSIVVDNQGNAYVAGDLSVSLTGLPLDDEMYGFVAKFDSKGDILWEGRLAARPDDVATDGLGNTYAVGSTGLSLGAPNAGRQDVFVCKFDSEGHHVWTEQFGTELTESGWGIAADALGNVFVTGTTFGTIGEEAVGSADPYAVKFDSDGNRLWAKQWGSVFYEQSFDVVADGQGGAYFAGYETFVSGEGDPIGNGAFVRRLDADGELLWVEYLESDGSDYGAGLALGPDGSVYVSGSTLGSLAAPNRGGTDAFVGKVDASGEPLWTIQLGTEQSELASSVTVDIDDNVYIHGLTFGPLAGPHLGGGGDAFLLKISGLVIPEPTTACLLACAVGGLITCLRSYHY